MSKFFLRPCSLTKMPINSTEFPAKKNRLAQFILTLCATLILLVIADLTLQWFLKVPSRYLKRVIRFEFSLSPAKRMFPNLNVTLVGAFNEFKFHVTTNDEGFRRS